MMSDPMGRWELEKESARLRDERDWWRRRAERAEADADQLAYLLERTWPSKADFAFTAKQRLEHHRTAVAARQGGDGD